MLQTGEPFMNHMLTAVGKGATVAGLRCATQGYARFILVPQPRCEVRIGGTRGNKTHEEFLCAVVVQETRCCVTRESGGGTTIVK